MAYTNMFLTAIAEGTLRSFAQRLKNTNAFLGSVQKKVAKTGESTVTFLVPGAITGGTRAAGSATGSAEKPTDTSAIITPNTEYYALLGLDRIEKARSQVDILESYAPAMANTILSKLGTALWALVSGGVTTNVVGDTGGDPDISLLHQANRKLFDCQAPMDGLVFCCGGLETQVYKPAMTYNVIGGTGEQAQVSGMINQLGGFSVRPDQLRLSSASINYNVAFHPEAFGVGFRSEILEAPGRVYGQATDPDTGISIFSEMRGVDDGTTGDGVALKVFLVAGVQTIHEKWACQVLNKA